MALDIKINFVSRLMDVLDSFHYKCEDIIYENDSMYFWSGSNIDNQ